MNELLIMAENGDPKLFVIVISLIIGVLASIIKNK